MEACLSVEREIEKVLTKFSGINDHTSKTLEELIEHVENLKRELSEAPQHSELSAAQILILTQLIKKIKDLVSRVATEHRDLHSTVSKVGKAIDRNFTVDFGAASLEGVFESPERTRIINEVICEHFFRQGMLDIGEALIEEAHLQIDESKKAPFFELNKILEALNNRNLQPALYWAEANRERLRSQHSSLEFKLHRLQFIDLLRQGPEKQSEALSYARKFEPFASNHARELQALMGSLIYIKQGIPNSPYAYFMDPIQWQEICDIFTRDACSLLGLSVDSPLSVSISAGCIALPALLNIKQVMQQRQVTGVWTSKDELPIEIDLGPSGRYHSIFACPILRQQSSDTNPPMRLICGHVISKDALNKLANGNKLKCPYCPVEQSPADARLIHF